EVLVVQPPPSTFDPVGLHDIVAADVAREHVHVGACPRERLHVREALPTIAIDPHAGAVGSCGLRERPREPRDLLVDRGEHPGTVAIDEPDLATLADDRDTAVEVTCMLEPR